MVEIVVVVEVDGKFVVVVETGVLVVDKELLLLQSFAQFVVIGTPAIA